MNEKLKFYLSRLKHHISSEFPESKLSVIYQYLYFSIKADVKKQFTTVIEKCQSEFNDLIQHIPQQALLEHKREFTKAPSDPTPLIPSAYYAQSVIRFNELSPLQKEQVLSKAQTIMWHLDLSIYPRNLANDQTLVDAVYIAYEWFVHTNVFSKNTHPSYMARQQQPFGPYLPSYQFQPVMLNAKKIEPIETPLLKRQTITVSGSESDSESDFEIEICQENLNSSACKQSYITECAGSLFANTDMNAISNWMGGKVFGKYRAHKKLDNGIQILSHSGGFALFFPPEVFHPFDIQVPITYPPNPEAECWIAGKNYGFIKIDVAKDQLADDESRLYVDADVNKALARVEQFVNDNFVNKQGLLPDNPYFTHGSYIKNPDMPRPCRMRLGGNYHVSF